MNTDNIKLFDYNDNFVPDFDEKIEQILISVHGENYYDVDEELVNTNIIPTQEEIYKDDELEKTMDLVDQIAGNGKKIEIVDKDAHKISIKDFIPVLFFILLFVIIVIAGYYFLNTADLSKLISK